MIKDVYDVDEYDPLYTIKMDILNNIFVADDFNIEKVDEYQYNITVFQRKNKKLQSIAVYRLTTEQLAILERRIQKVFRENHAGGHHLMETAEQYIKDNE